ncbi:MAG: zinc-binding dehydrogenase, partial [Phycisphaerae bacterium]
MATPIKAVVFTDINQVSIGTFELGTCGPTELVTRTLYSMISSGTELRVLGGHYGSKGNFPLIPGYSSVSQITAIGAEVKGFRVGDLVSCRNPRPFPGIKSQWGAQTSAQVHGTSGEDRPILLPPGANPLDYVIAEISAISFRGVEAAAPQPGDIAVVLGQGLIGAFSGAWLAARGCRVIVADVEPNRLARAAKWGAAATVNITEPDAEERIKALCNGGADIVVESS